MIKNIVRKILLFSLPSLFMTCCLVEIFFRLFMPVSDQPVRYFNPTWNLWQAKPRQEGHFILGKWGEIYNEPYRLNNVGWNSPHDYSLEKPAGTLRIAVIGDSFVEGFRVDYHDTFSQILENILNETSATSVEVYNFGVTGAPLSQYLQIMRFVAATYAPDIYVINLYYNDFDESFAQNVPQPEVLQFGLDENGDIYEVPPQDPHLPFWREAVISPAVVRYVRFNLGYSTPSELWGALKGRWNKETQSSIPVDDANTEVPTFQFRTELITKLLYYAFPEIQRLASQGDSNLIFMMDGLRSEIVSHKSLEEIQAQVGYKYNQLVAEVSADLGIPLLDLTTTFYDDFQANEQPFDFGSDGHWNVHGHNLIGHVLADKLIELGWVE